MHRYASEENVILLTATLLRVRRQSDPAMRQHAPVDGLHACASLTSLRVRVQACVHAYVCLYVCVCVREEEREGRKEERGRESEIYGLACKCSIEQ